jgi:hypothetical protein
MARCHEPRCSPGNKLSKVARHSGPRRDWLQSKMEAATAGEYGGDLCAHLGGAQKSLCRLGKPAFDPQALRNALSIRVAPQCVAL